METEEESSKVLATKKQTKRKGLTGVQKAEICYLQEKGILTMLLRSDKEPENSPCWKRRWLFGCLGQANYKRIFCKDRIDVFDTFLKFGGSFPEPITIKDMIDFSKELVQINKLDITNEIQDLIIRLPLDQPINAKEYVNSDNNLITTEVLNDDEIIEAVKNHECIEPEDEISNKSISFAQSLGFIDRILLFFEQQPDGTFKIDDTLIQNLEKLKKELRLKNIASQQQATLDSF
ncbi:27896_t:CDS:2, partial [Racocetra persica]